MNDKQGNLLIKNKRSQINADSSTCLASGQIKTIVNKAAILDVVEDQEVVRSCNPKPSHHHTPYYKEIL